MKTLAWTFAASALIMFLLPFGFYLVCDINYKFTDYATFVGGTAGPLAALAGFLFIYLTFQHQQDQLYKLEQQFFENKFFKLLDFYIKERDLLNINYPGLSGVHGRDTFFHLYQYYFNEFNKRWVEKNQIVTDFPLVAGFSSFHKEIEINLSEYHRSFQLILKYIDDNKQYEYLEYVSALMDENELVFQAFYYKTVGFELSVDIVQEYKFLHNVNPEAFIASSCYYEVFNLPQPEPDDFSNMRAD